MATIKSYTDLSQSKKLAEILPIDSADMYWDLLSKDKYARVNNIGHCLGRTCVYAWSLAALLNVLKIFIIPTAFSVKISTPSLTKTENGYKLTYTGGYTPTINNGLDIEAPIESIADNPIDACYELILKLNESNLL